MICWGDINNCGILVLDDSNVHKKDLCRCSRDSCIKYLPNSRFLHSNEKELKQVLIEVDTYAENSLRELAELVKIKSMGRNSQYHTETLQIMQRLAVRLTALSFSVDMVEIEPLREGKDVKQFAIFASYFSMPTKNVLLIYFNADIPSIPEHEVWTSDPFELIERGNRLYGKGSATSRAPILCWLYAIEAWLTITNDLPINIRIIIDSSFCSGSEGLRALIETRKHFLAPVDFIIICTNLWIGDSTPLLTNSHTGYVYFALELTAKSNPNQIDEDDDQSDDDQTDKHQHTDREPMSELILMMNTLVDANNQILVYNYNRGALTIQHHDWLLLNSMEISINDLKHDLNASRLLHEDSRTEMLMHKMCMPTLSIHSIRKKQASSFKNNFKPAMVYATFSIKLVALQNPAIIIKLVRNHLDIMYHKLKCTHQISLRVLDQLAPIYEPKHSTINKRIVRAFNRSFNSSVAIGDNISICFPMLNVLRKYCMPEAHAIPLPFWSIHVNNRMGDESVSKKRYIRNQNLCSCIIYELSKLSATCKCDYVPNFCMERKTNIHVKY